MSMAPPGSVPARNDHFSIRIIDLAPSGYATRGPWSFKKPPINTPKKYTNVHMLAVTLPRDFKTPKGTPPGSVPARNDHLSIRIIDLAPSGYATRGPWSFKNIKNLLKRRCINVSKLEPATTAKPSARGVDGPTSTHSCGSR